MKRQDVVGAVIYQDGYILLARRSDAELNGKWEFPGGKVEPGETHEAALQRELREELGIDVAIGRQAGYSDFDIRNTRFRLTCYYATIRHGQPIPKEHTAVSWIPIAKLLSYDLAPADIPIARGVCEDDR